MSYIKADAQPSGHVGRTYFNISYHHDDGTNWIGIVEAVEAGETEITAAEYEAAWQANHDFNVAYETQRIADAKKLPGVKAGEIVSLDAQLADVQSWPEPDLAKFKDELVRQANDQTMQMEPATVAALIGADEYAVLNEAQAQTVVEAP